VLKGLRCRGGVDVIEVDGDNHSASGVSS
jgi:hypothetical protein